MEKLKLSNGLIEIEAGQTVSNFLKDLNDNFENVQVKIKNAPKSITISDAEPVDGEGNPGDIWIVYEV